MIRKYSHLYPELLDEAPGLDLTGARKIKIDLVLEQATASTPSIVKVGGFKGFSLPIWSTGATATEQVYTRFSVPDQWKSGTPATLRLFCCQSATESSGDNFQMKFLWGSGAGGSLATSTLSSASGDSTIATGSNEKYTIYETEIAIPAANITVDTVFEGLIRRVASSGTDVSNEVYILGARAEFLVDKIFGV